MPDKTIHSARKRIPVKTSRLLRYAFVGGAVGLFVGVLVVFLMALFYGEAIGFRPGACLFFACTEAMLLSQPAGVAGMAVGAAVGLMAGSVIYYVHHHLPRAS
jgi:hypothetical protein